MTKQVFHVRPLGAPDGAAYKALRLQAIAESPSAVWPTQGEEAGRTIDEVRARITMTANQAVFGAFAGDQLVAIAGVRREPLVQVAHKGVLWGVFVAPDYRREGLARQLIGTAVAHAREAGILQLHLAVNTENRRARQLYQSLGFMPFGVEPRAMRVGGRFYDEEQMILRLDEGAPG